MLVFSSCLLPLFGEITREERIGAIDKQIKVLEERRSRYKASARLHEDEFDRWQFDSSRIDEARLAERQAQIDRMMVKSIDDKIAELQTERAQLEQNS